MDPVWLLILTFSLHIAPKRGASMRRAPKLHAHNIQDTLRRVSQASCFHDATLWWGGPALGLLIVMKKLSC